MAGYTSSVAVIFLTVGELFGSAVGAASVDEAVGSLRKGVTGRQDRAEHRLTLTVQSPQAHQQLVICNAYTSKKGLDVIQVRTKDRVTGESPLAYKQCREFALPLQEGDQLDFKAGDLDVGTFYATGLPKSSASLLLVPHRREPHTASISFESHAFADVQNPQIAVVDAYKGHAGGNAVKIIENHQASGGAPVAGEPLEEDLNFNSVVAVNPGRYQVSLIGSGQDAAMPLSAREKAKYVILRVGNDAFEASKSKSSNSEYGQELVVFPSNSGGRRLSQLGLLVVVVTMVSVFSGFAALP